MLTRLSLITTAALSIALLIGLAGCSSETADTEQAPGTAITEPLGASGINATGRFESATGFTANIPQDWTVVDGEHVRNNPELFESFFNNGGEQTFDENLLAQLRATIKAGSLEFYFPQSNPHVDFRDNVNIQKTVGRIPANAEETAQVCPEFSDSLSQAFGRRVEVQACDLRQTGAHSTLFAMADGALPGSTMTQYQLQHDPSVIMVITATTHDDTTPIVGAQLKAFIESMTF